MEADRDGNPQRVIVVLDTNALMMPAQFRIDLFSELQCLLGSYEPVVLDEVTRELEGISGGHGKDAAAARHGLEITRRCRNEPSGIEGDSVDERIAGYARKHRGFVVTNDRGLRNRLLLEGVPVISLKNQRKLGIIRR